MLFVRVPPEVHVKVQQAAEDLGLSLSTYVALILARVDLDVTVVEAE